MKYQVVSASRGGWNEMEAYVMTLLELEKAVNETLCLGWHLQGGVSVTQSVRVYGGSHDRYTNVTASQAMVYDDE